MPANSRKSLRSGILSSINAKRMLVVVAGVVGLAGAALGIMNLLNAKRMLLGLAGAVGLAGAAQAADISGAGATFPYPIYSKWADAYRQKTGIGLNYQSIGSGGGIRQDAAFLHDPSGARLQPRPAARRGLGRSRLRRGALGRRAHTPAAPGARTHRT